MSDRRLRQLEREASGGDPKARRALRRERVRSGLCVWCGAELGSCRHGRLTPGRPARPFFGLSLREMNAAVRAFARAFADASVSARDFNRQTRKIGSLRYRKHRRRR